jgi:DNA ligase (NAD+)
MHINNQLVKDINANPYAILDKLSIKEIIKLLTQANQSYHQDGKPLFSDDIYDLIRSYLQKLVPDHPLVLNDVGAAVPKKDRVKLPVFMGSQNKIRDDPEHIAKWKESYSGSFVVSDKLDGISCLYVFDSKTREINLYTRGDGNYGQDISHLLKYINIPPITKEIANDQSVSSNYIIRGELILTKNDWNKHLKGTYTNPRNTVAGLANSKNPDINVAKYINFVTYELIKPQLKPSASLLWLKQNHFDVVFHNVIKNNELTIERLSSLLVLRRAHSAYEVDGIVISHNAIHEIPDDKNPKNSFAFKSIITMEKVEVIVTNVEWNISKNGLLKPVVVFDTVYISGVNIHRASGYNANFIESNVIGPGSRVVIIRSGDVIPKIQEVITPSSSNKPLFPDELQYPWKWNDNHVEIVLKNPHLADDYHLKQLQNYVNIFKIKGIGSKIIKRLYDNGVDNIKKLVNITKVDLYRATHSSKLTMKIYVQMQNIYSNALCSDFMAASNIFGGGFGRSKFELITRAFPSVLNNDLPLPTVNELLTTKGLGERYARQFLEHISDFHEFMQNAGLMCRSINDIFEQPNEGEMALNGKIIVFTGFRSKELEEFIVKRGGKVSTSVSVNTSIVVIKYIGEQGNKAELATKLGIPLIILSDFEVDIGFKGTDEPPPKKKKRDEESSEPSEFKHIREFLEEEGLMESFSSDEENDMYSNVKLTKKADCVRQTLNWSKLKRTQIFGKQSFNADDINNSIAISSPKLNTLLHNISTIDMRDMEVHGKKFKHMIYADAKFGYGIKIVAGALQANGFNHAYNDDFEIDKKKLKKHKSNSFAVLAAAQMFSSPINVSFKQELLKTYNSRPDNIHGELIRFILLDSGYKEGIDLFDVKYVHLYEPFLTYADEQQTIGRATRFCGQRGLKFDKKDGWKLHVFKYEHTVPEKYIDEFNGNSSYEIIAREMNWNTNLVNLTKEIESVCLEGAIDRQLTKNIHNYKYKKGGSGGGSYSCDSSDYSSGGNGTNSSLSDHNVYKWSKVKMENLCDAPVQHNTLLEYSPTQKYIQDYFVPSSPNKGIFLWHSLGSGKTCTAIATASHEWEAEGYTIVWVTRGTLRSDVYKNMFDMSCVEKIREYLKKGKKMPDALNARKRLLSKSWVPPISYKQFNNALLKQNRLYDFLIKKNGFSDPLKKTLLIIDEAHLMLSPTMKEADKPDIDLLKAWLRHSFKVSGQDSGRIILMSATPITNDPFTITKLLNLTSENIDMPDTQEKFIDAYLNNETLEFTKSGKELFKKDIHGRVSYLNRTKDVRQFSQPVIHNINVPISELVDVSVYVNNIDEKLEEIDKLKLIRLKDIENQEDYDMVDEIYKESLEDCKKNKDKNEAKECVKEIKDTIKEKKAELKELFKDKLADVKAKIIEIKDDVKEKKKDLKIKQNEDMSIVKVLRSTCYKKPREKKQKKKRATGTGIGDEDTDDFDEQS